jgi:broad specificity phosphatase PhoE
LNGGFINLWFVDRFAAAGPLSGFTKTDATAICRGPASQRARKSALHRGATLNYLSALEKLSNRYFAMRHGHSLANQQGIIVSHADNGCVGYGLSAQGRNQVEASLRQNDLLDADTIVLSSDFSRAVESATIAADLLGCSAGVETDLRLRERDFGELELGPDSAYASVWEQDEQDADGLFRAVESANRVMARVTGLILDLEQRHVDATLLLVSHGDALQILQTAFAGRDASAHRQLQHLQTAEIRPLLLAAS